MIAPLSRRPPRHRFASPAPSELLEQPREDDELEASPLALALAAAGLSGGLLAVGWLLQRLLDLVGGGAS